VHAACAADAISVAMATAKTKNNGLAIIWQRIM
jgi:hypothetical protein